MGGARRLTICGGIEDDETSVYGALLAIRGGECARVGMPAEAVRGLEDVDIVWRVAESVEGADARDATADDGDSLRGLMWHERRTGADANKSTRSGKTVVGSSLTREIREIDRVWRCGTVVWLREALSLKGLKLAAEHPNVVGGVPCACVSPRGAHDRRGRGRRVSSKGLTTHERIGVVLAEPSRLPRQAHSAGRLDRDNDAVAIRTTKVSAAKTIRGSIMQARAV